MSGQAAQVEKVGQDVIEAIQSDGGANVVIALVKPQSIQTPQIDLDTLHEEVNNLQDQVLSTLDTSEYRERYRYQSIPALAGRITAAGLAKLVADPNVLRIDLDLRGAGILSG